MEDLKSTIERVYEERVENLEQWTNTVEEEERTVSAIDSVLEEQKRALDAWEAAIKERDNAADAKTRKELINTWIAERETSEKRRKEATSTNNQLKNQMSSLVNTTKTLKEKYNKYYRRSAILNMQYINNKRDYEASQFWVYTNNA
uniref:Wsv412 n=1 Tax=White spot syndrome virus TaxID=92652 RepID=A0A2U9GGD4_WSSV|nr:wsv412 [Shrimp white spot syndrome virus]